MFRMACFPGEKARLLALALGLFLSASGCTSFQQLSTEKWFAAKWPENHSGPQVAQAMAYWDHNVHVTENTVNRTPVPGLFGRVILFGDGGVESADAQGKVVVTMADLTTVQPGAAPEILNSWTFEADALKRLRRRDYVGDGYSLFIPWPNYRPEVKKVQIHVAFHPDKGSPIQAEPMVLGLNTNTTTPMIQQTNYSTIPAKAGKQ